MWIPRDAMILLYISIPFLLGAGALLLIGEYGTKGWDGLSLVVYGFLVLAAWAVIVLGFCAWIVLRDGFQPTSILPGTVLIAALAAAGIWGGAKLLEQRRCEQAAGFFAAVAHADPADRAGLIAANRRFIAEPTWCGRDAVKYWFGLDHEGRPAAPGGDADRLAALRQLLAAGLPPDDALIYDAARGGDAAAVAVLAEYRSAAGLDPWPPRSAFAALEGYHVAADPERRRHLATLRLFVEGGVDPCAKSHGLTLGDSMTREGVNWRGWRPGAAGECNPS